MTRTTLIERPVIVLAAPRSGSSLLFAVLSAHPELWSLYRESNQLLEGPFHPSHRGWSSNLLEAVDLTPELGQELLRRFFHEAGNLERLPFGRRFPLRGRGRRKIARSIALASRPIKHAPIRLVEKSPRNTLRISFLRALFPDARFLHLVRDPRGNIASLYRAWQTVGRYKTYPLPDSFRIEGYAGSHWSFLLQPGWRTLNGSPLIDVCADQWRSCNEHCLEGLAQLGQNLSLRVRYEDLIRQPAGTLADIARWADIDPRPFMRFSLRLPVIQAQEPPEPGKWRSLESQLDRVLPGLEGTARRLGYG